jgi:cyclophilin family peptidyl-prolyl cis-trans isomerase
MCLVAACQPNRLHHRAPTAPAVFRARVETSKGPFVIEVHREWAPKGADRMYQLILARYFDDSRFYRVRAGFIAQFGIAGDSRVAMEWRDSTIADDSVLQTNARGTFAFAMTGPESRSTQVYINLADNKQLDAQGFSPIGRVVEGMDVVDKLFSLYGENAGGGVRAGNQAKLFEDGNVYLDDKFPLLDRLVRVRIVQ